MDRLRKLAGILTESTQENINMPSIGVNTYGQYTGTPFETDLPRGAWNQIIKSDVSADTRSDEFNKDAIELALNDKVAMDVITNYVAENAQNNSFVEKYMTALKGFNELGETLVVEHGLNLTSLQEEHFARLVANGGNTKTLTDICEEFGVKPIYDGNIATLTFPSHMTAMQFDGMRKTIKEAHVSDIQHNINNGVTTMRIKLL